MMAKRLSQLSLVMGTVLIGAIATRATAALSPGVTAVALGLAILLILLSVRLKN